MIITTNALQVTKLNKRFPPRHLTGTVYLAHQQRCAQAWTPVSSARSNCQIQEALTYHPTVRARTTEIDTAARWGRRERTDHFIDLHATVNLWNRGLKCCCLTGSRSDYVWMSGISKNSTFHGFKGFSKLPHLLQAKISATLTCLIMASDFDFYQSNISP